VASQVPCSTHRPTSWYQRSGHNLGSGLNFRYLAWVVKSYVRGSDFKFRRVSKVRVLKGSFYIITLPSTEFK